MYSFNAYYEDFSLKFRCCSPVCSMNYCSCLHNRLSRTGFMEIQLSHGQTHSPLDMLCWTYSYSLPQILSFFMQLGKLLDIHHTAFLSSFFIGLSRVTIVFSYCPQIAKASLHVGGQCLDIKQKKCTPKSYISLHKLYKLKKKKNNNNDDNDKTMLRLTGIQQQGVLHAHACIH